MMWFVNEKAYKLFDLLKFKNIRSVRLIKPIPENETQRYKNIIRQENASSENEKMDVSRKDNGSLEIGLCLILAERLLL